MEIRFDTDKTRYLASLRLRLMRSVEKVLGGILDVDSESHPPRMAAASTGPAYASRWRAARRHVIGRKDLPGNGAQVSREVGSKPSISQGELRIGLRRSLDILKRSQKSSSNDHAPQRIGRNGLRFTSHIVSMH